ncbi:hypothetical protein HPB51_009348 [Rhipicephalus microplus]|uniref:Uncharacterized protein n=1 Tax=Rhipicephalus microplus TaxID=6941 RepID=A0A9J6F0X8_RHIMP|nr:hypothetical protein HPB51_009348 [Rhipicephalus microplus]
MTFPKCQHKLNTLVKSVESTPVPVKKVKATDVCKTGSTFITREERLFMFLSSELSKACGVFLNNIILAFETVNCHLQAQAPQIHKLQPIVLNLLEDILSRFVRPALLKQHNDICLIDYHSRNVQKNDQDLVIGHQAKCVVEKLKPSDKKEFFEAVRRGCVKPTFSQAVLSSSEQNCSVLALRKTSPLVNMSARHNPCLQIF